MGREREGGGQFTSNLGPEWTGIAPHTKEGLQVSERDLRTREGGQAKGKLKRGIIKGFVPCALILSICIYISCYCLYVANKRIVFRL
jgi:hypothetical protein